MSATMEPPGTRTNSVKESIIKSPKTLIYHCLLSSLSLLSAFLYLAAPLSLNCILGEVGSAFFFFFFLYNVMGEYG
jgi:hypothetical protein